MLDQVLTALQTDGITFNPRKCEWAIQENDWLGYWLTPDGLKPWHKNIDAILRMDRPRNIKHMHGFLGVVNYYRDMWPKRAHLLSPLSNKSGKKTFHWTGEMDRAFLQIKAILRVDTLIGVSQS